MPPWWLLPTPRAATRSTRWAEATPERKRCVARASTTSNYVPPICPAVSLPYNICHDLALSLLRCVDYLAALAKRGFTCTTSGAFASEAAPCWEALPLPLPTRPLPLSPSHHFTLTQARSRARRRRAGGRAATTRCFLSTTSPIRSLSSLHHPSLSSLPHHIPSSPSLSSLPHHIPSSPSLLSLPHHNLA